MAHRVVTENKQEKQASQKGAEKSGEVEYLAKVRKEILATTFEDALNIAMARGFDRIEFTQSGIRYDIVDYLKENAEGGDDDANYAIFNDVIIRVGDAWSEDAEVIQLMY